KFLVGQAAAGQLFDWQEAHPLHSQVGAARARAFGSGIPCRRGGLLPGHRPGGTAECGGCPGLLRELLEPGDGLALGRLRNGADVTESREPGRVPDLPIRLVVVVCIELAVVQQSAAGPTPVVVCAAAKHFHHVTCEPGARIEATPSPLAAITTAG